jgi:hypothetical protein
MDSPLVYKLLGSKLIAHANRKIIRYIYNSITNFMMDI